MALASVALLLAGCTSQLTDDPCDLTSPPSPSVLTRPAYPQVSEVESNVGIVVNNSGPPSRITVRLDGEVALGVELPDAHGCAHSPVYSYYYDMPAGPVEVSAASGDGRTKTAPMLVDEDMRWVLVTTQESFPMHLTVRRDRPAFG